jgi:hypothetical protein
MAIQVLGMPKIWTMARELAPEEFSISMGAGAASNDKLGGLQLYEHIIFYWGHDFLGRRLSCSST